MLEIVQFKHLISFIDLSGSRSASLSEVEDQILSRAMTGKMSAFNRVELALKLNKDASTTVMKEAFEKLSPVISATVQSRRPFKLQKAFLYTQGRF